MRRSDKLLIIVLLGCAILGYVVFRFSNPNSIVGAEVVASVDGSHYDTYAISENQEVKIEMGESYNIFRIEDGEVNMISADCPDQICVHHRSIHSNGETIVCLPNRVILEVKGTEQGELDTNVN